MSRTFAGPLEGRPNRSSWANLLALALQTFHGRTVALETVDEVMAKKLRYRAAHFTDRDGFDLACVLRIRPEVALTLAAEVGDTLSRARLALEGGDPDRIRARIRDPGPEFEDILKDPITEALKALGTIERERDNPLSAVERERVQAVARQASHIEPGTSRGEVLVDWFEADADRKEAHFACVRSAPLAAKAAVLSEWRRRDPETFEAWDARNRPGAPETGRIRDRSRDVYGL